MSSLRSFLELLTLPDECITYTGHTIVCDDSPVKAGMVYEGLGVYPLRNTHWVLGVGQLGKTVLTPLLDRLPVEDIIAINLSTLDTGLVSNSEERMRELKNALKASPAYLRSLFVRLPDGMVATPNHGLYQGLLGGEGTVEIENFSMNLSFTPINHIDALDPGYFGKTLSEALNRADHSPMRRKDVRLYQEVKRWQQLECADPLSRVVSAALR